MGFKVLQHHELTKHLNKSITSSLRCPFSKLYFIKKEVMMMEKPHVAIIGSCVCDVIIELPHLPISKEDVNVKNQSLSLGGCACNVANIIQLFEIPYVLFSPIGTGIYGDFVREQLIRNSMHSLLPHVDGENGCCYCMIEESGERTFISYHGAEYRFQPECFNILETYPIDTIYVCGLEIEEETGIHILNYLRRHKDCTIYFAPGPRICYIEESKMKAMLELGVILHINEQEALQYTKRSSIEQASRVLFQLTHSPIIITLGENGSYCYDGIHDIREDSTKITPVDTIGAGDSHIGSILATRSNQMDWKQSLAIANCVASCVVSIKGSLLSKDSFSSISLPK